MSLNTMPPTVTPTILATCKQTRFHLQDGRTSGEVRSHNHDIQNCISVHTHIPYLALKHPELPLKKHQFINQIASFPRLCMQALILNTRSTSKAWTSSYHPPRETPMNSVLPPRTLPPPAAYHLNLENKNPGPRAKKSSPMRIYV